VDAHKDIDSIERFFSDPEAGPFDGRAIAVFAHPDDASIAFGAQLGRFHDLDLVVVTDGAPTHLNYAANKGFGTTEAYAQARWDEMESALSLMGIPHDRAFGYGFEDGSASRRLLTLIERLEKDLAGADVVLTHCFEGGHTDHDAVAMAVHLACAAIEEARRPVIVEAPLYSLQAGLFTTQTLPAGGSGRAVSPALSPMQQALKRQIKICYRTQRYSLAQFSDEVERYRIAPTYDFGQLPNNGALLYEVNGFMSGSQWLAMARMCKALLDRPRGSAPAVTIDESVEILRKLVAASAPSRRAAKPAIQYRAVAARG
jgi:LmbE family N-acetylglucosaminyl deacetylase